MSDDEWLLVLKPIKRMLDERDTRIAELETLLVEIDDSGYIKDKVTGSRTDLEGRVWRAIMYREQTAAR